MHSPFPGFNTLLEGIFWDLFELCRCGHFNGIAVRKMGFLQNSFGLGEEEKVTRGQIEGLWEVFQSCHVPFCKKLINTLGCVIMSIDVMEPPCVSFPKRSAFCHALSHEASKNVFINVLVHSLVLGWKFKMNDVLNTFFGAS